ncbi:MBL fold metallo-hydrolase [Methanolobus sp. ZRKC3]|uniref:MBL fold metallo-hydrolase n=1 Tax=Methanolobus sp. ZRKC3 TaxID=3125786 RepID=UPI00324723F2
MGSTNVGNVSITWLGYAGFMIKSNDRVIYIDPFILPESISDDDLADIILITHEHPEHCCPDSIRRVRKLDTTTLIPENMSLKFKGDARRILEGDLLTGDLAIKGIDIQVVPAFNKFSPYHLEGDGVGYILELGGVRIYHAGDTDFIPEIDPGDGPIGIALLPIGGVSVMDEVKASEAALLLSPATVIPMHYNNGGDPEKFRTLVNEGDSSIEVIIL